MTPEKDKLYRINCPESAYHGAVVMCLGDSKGTVFYSKKLPTYPCRVLFSTFAHVTQIIYAIEDHLEVFDETRD
jgi:hypothetical protein